MTVKLTQILILSLKNTENLPFWDEIIRLTEKVQTLPEMLLGKVVICLQKTETRFMFLTLFLY
jgi:hypothetical protein